MTINSNEANNIPKLLTMPEVGEILRISKAKAYRLAQKGEILSIKSGRSVRVSLEDLKNYLKNNTYAGSELI